MQPIPLALDTDKLWLTPLHCFVRRQCVELFTATDDDIKAPSKGKRKPVRSGQVGIRCPWCHKPGAKLNSYKTPPERSSVYYPTGIKSIYSASMNLLQRHLHSCPSVPEGIMRQYETLKADDARSATSKKYWEESAVSLGLVDTPNGIQLSGYPAPPVPNIPTDQQYVPAKRKFDETIQVEPSDVGAQDVQNFSNVLITNADTQQNVEFVHSEHPGLVTAEDEPHATPFLFLLLGQMRPCLFTETDRLGKRRGLPTGFPGLACKHCYGEYGSGRFFPSSIKTLADTSKTLNLLHNHMMRCRRCPVEVREQLETLRATHEEERAKRFGSQKNFFTRIWETLHGKGYPKNLKIHLSIQKFEAWKQTALERVKQKADLEAQTAKEAAESTTQLDQIITDENFAAMEKMKAEEVVGETLLAEVEPVVEKLAMEGEMSMQGEIPMEMPMQGEIPMEMPMQGEIPMQGGASFDGVVVDAALMEQHETDSAEAVQGAEV